MQPVVSIVIPTYQRCSRLKKALQSVISQTYKDFEVLIMDDGSNDGTKEMVMNLNDSRISYYWQKNSGGPAKPRNEGIKKARGKYVVRLDSDDYVNFDYLNILYLYIENNNFDAVGWDYYLVDDNENFLEKRNCMTHPIGSGIIFRIAQLVDIGLYDENFLINEEVELRKRFEKKYSVERVPLPLYRYRQHISNMTKKKR